MTDDVRQVAGSGAGRWAAAVVVAHPDDEVLWAGGLILAHPEWDWFVACLCRASDPDRAPRFYRVLDQLQATGAMADLDDSVEQMPLALESVAEAVRRLLPARRFDLLVTHGPQGEYTRHRRHEEVSQAVTGLWLPGDVQADALWWFAYEDGGRAYLPRAAEYAHRIDIVPATIWEEKYRLVTEVYGFAPTSWEAQVVPREEGFWCFPRGTVPHLPLLDAASWSTEQQP